MTIDVLLFGPVREAFSTACITVPLSTSATAGDLVAALEAMRPESGPLLRRCRVAVDRSLVEPGAEIEAPSEVAIIPPVGGG